MQKRLLQPDRKEVARKATAVACYAVHNKRLVQYSTGISHVILYLKRLFLASFLTFTS